MRLFLLLALGIAVVIVIFTFQNQSEIVLTFMQWELTGPVPLILAVPFFVGIVAGMSLLIPGSMKKGKVARTSKKRVQELEHELVAVNEEMEKLKQEEAKEPEVKETEGDHTQL